ncbi:PIG-L deacetylase family protein [Thalassotalea sp. G2M2-11]|uniref:PIG-L deacetylase family protein n=1 Tax=Thalassotalea sp. G2M2-11 TaxID=2787627 RepID=UPI0019D0562A|nr:PIG-L deacetylase family protein [Thalassotalea sp. G2M2-11]
MTKVLVVVAHADDEALGCGGSLAKHAAKGDDISLIVLTNGVSARIEQKDALAIDQRRKALKKAAELLGIQEVVQCDFPDNQLDSVSLLEIAQTIERHCLKLQPEVIYTHSQHDLNIDHRLTAQAVVTAFRPLPDSSVKRILAFEVLSSTEWYIEPNGFQANWFSDISEFLPRKLEALACYQEEMRAFPHPRSFQGIDILAKFRGMSVGLEAAEAFQVIRNIDKNS